MSHESCPRQIAFSLPGVPGVLVTATEVSGTIEFAVDVIDSTKSTGDLRALFFHIDEAELAGLTVTSSSPLLKESRVGKNNVIDLGDGANLSGKVKTGFDVGLEWGTPGNKKDDINFEVKFTLSNSSGDLDLDDIGRMLFGAKLDAVGGPGGPRGSTSKLTVVAPHAPDAVDDAVEIFEDGAAGLNSPSKTPAPVEFFVLANDTDEDGASTLLIDHIIEEDGPQHGTAEVSADGKSILYTPDGDYSGTDSFWYCLTDGNGGQDSALVTVTIKAVADEPVITFEVAQGSHINETLITVTATQNDDDQSEDITSLSWAVAGGGAPAGVTITPAGPVAGSGDQLIQQFVVTTAAEQDWNFDIDFTAVSTEASNGDEELHTEARNIEIDYTGNFDTLTYGVVDQSIWSTGDEFVRDYDEFLGVDESFSATLGDDVITGTFLKGSASIKAGFDVDFHFEGGQIDATVPIDVSIETTYNKTTDTLYIDPSLALGSGGSFVTTGPEGSFKLDFIFEAMASLHASLLYVDLYNDSFSSNHSENILDLDSSDPAAVYTILGGLVDIGFEWPHISVTGETSGSGTSNDFLFATLDVDQLANFLLSGALSFLDSDPLDGGNFELLDFDITGGLNFHPELCPWSRLDGGQFGARGRYGHTADLRHADHHPQRPFARRRWRQDGVVLVRARSQCNAGQRDRAGRQHRRSFVDPEKLRFRVGRSALRHRRRTAVHRLRRDVRAERRR